MWIKSLYDDTWVSMKHVTHFRIESDDLERKGNNLGYAYLDTSSMCLSQVSQELSPLPSSELNQARILVC